MLIDQMKEHPEEFRGYAGKFASMLDSASNALQGTLRNTYMSKRDATAILTAAETHLYEVWLAEDVLTRMLAPEQEPEKGTLYNTPNKLGIWQGAVPPGSMITANTAGNTITAQYEQAYQMELAKYKMEIAKQRREEEEHAMRTTKSLQGFL
jgi:hypothetical protein